MDAYRAAEHVAKVLNLWHKGGAASGDIKFWAPHAELFQSPQAYALVIEALAAAAAFLGHCYPVWLKFHGGKGVATLMGIVLALHWPIALIYAVLWLGLLATLRISSGAGMVAAISTPKKAAPSVTP